MYRKPLTMILTTLLLITSLPVPGRFASAAETTATTTAMTATATETTTTGTKPADTTASGKAAASGAADQAPAKAELATIGSPAYNKVTLSWKKAAGTTHYFVYYKEEGAERWKQVAVVSGTKLNYTHTASKNIPITVGKKYAYTVLSYNGLTKKRGDFDKKGLTISTRPDKVTLGHAVWNEDQSAVTLSWEKAGGATAYLIYRKTDSSPKWTRLAALKAGALKYVDKSPAGEKSYYTVLSYNLETKAAGTCDKNGVTPVTEEEARTSDLAKIVGSTKTASKTGQIILVVDHNLSFWEKSSDGNWNRKLSVYCGYGSNGMSEDRTEGDRTTPIGSFPILHGFGIADNPGTTLQYKKVTSNSYWSGEKSTYNTWVESARRIGGEHLIDYYQYKYAMAIGFNRNPTVYKKGAAIFLHCKSYTHWSTAGCVSVEEKVMKQLLQMSRNGVYIIIVKDQADIANY